MCQVKTSRFHAWSFLRLESIFAVLSTLLPADIQYSMFFLNFSNTYKHICWLTELWFYVLFNTTQNKHKKLKPGLVAFYNIWPGNGVGLFFNKEKISKGEAK